MSSYSRTHVMKYQAMLNRRLMSTDYDAVFGTLTEEGAFIAQDEGEGSFLLRDKTGAVLPHGYGEDIDRALVESPQMIIAYAGG
jgi:hypothetical protein